MKVLLVIDSDATYSICRTLLQQAGADCIRYRNPVKAMDNIEEVAPDFMMIHTGDFPRHWKTIAQFAAGCGLVPGSHVVLIKTPYFNSDEADKATEMGISTLIDNPTVGGDVSALQKTLTNIFPPILTTQELPTKEPENAEVATTAFITPKEKPILCLFTNPATDTIVTGTVETITETSFTFIPDAIPQIAGINGSTTVSDVTVKIDGTIITPTLTVTTDGRTVFCTITDISADDKKCIESYLKTLES